MSDFTKDEWGFHSDSAMRNGVLKVLSSFPFTSVVETGTFFGSTLAFLENNFDGPCFSCDIHDGMVIVAKKRKWKGTTQISVKDSADFLTEGDFGEFPFFFLDAHLDTGSEPLRKELNIIAMRWQKAVVLIDDCGDDYLDIFRKWRKGRRCAWPYSPIVPHVFVFQGVGPVIPEYYHA